MATKEAARKELAHVKLGEDAKTVPSGTMTVQQLKSDLGVDPADVLYLKKGNERTLLADHESIEVKSGMHFEAISGGGVS
jgi:hypothetical protein